MKKIITLLLSLFLANRISYSQETPHFFDIIKDDSVVMYFGPSNYVVEKECARFFRYIRVNTDANYNGAFIDKLINDQVLTTGNYINGIKEGYFEFFYENGNIRSKGYYSQNKQIGKWEFYYPNNQLERIVIVSDVGVQLIEFRDSTGKILVESGNGTLDAIIDGKGIDGGIKVKGQIFNGFPDGKWESSMWGELYCLETFKNGKFIKGEYPNINDVGSKYYKGKSNLYDFIPKNYLEETETFKFIKCNNIILNQVYTKKIETEEPKKYEFDYNRFTSDLGSTISRVMENDAKRGAYAYYTIGDNNFSVEFKVDSNGKPYDFAMNSGFGDQFYQPIISIIKSRTLFSPTDKPMFFHMTIHLNDGHMYSYNYRFSDKRY